MGVPLVIIHARLGFSIIHHKFWGTPQLWKSPTGSEKGNMIG